MSNQYKPKSLIPAYKLGFYKSEAQCVAVPSQKFSGDDLVTVIYKNESMQVKASDKFSERTFEDQYGRGDYTLYYFHWNPTSQLKLG